jgi:hypothetical protein
MNVYIRIHSFRYLDKLTSGIDRPSTSGKQANKNDGNSLNNPSTESLFFQPETKSDLTFNRRPHTSVQRIKTAQSMRSSPDAMQRIKTTQSMRSAPDTMQRIKTAQSMRYPPDTTSISTSKRPQTGLPMARDRFAQPMKSQGDIIPITTSKNLTRQRPVTRRQISRERLEYLAQPKNYRFQSSGIKHIRPHMGEQTPTPDELFGELSERPPTKLEQMHDELLEKCEKAIHGECFRHLVDGFSQVHHAETSNLQTVKNIIQSNASLQDDKGHWRTIRPTAANSRPVFRNHRQTLADQLHKKLDVFLIDVGA